MKQSVVHKPVKFFQFFETFVVRTHQITGKGGRGKTQTQVKARHQIPVKPSSKKNVLQNNPLYFISQI